MKVSVGIDRLIIEPESDSDRVILHYFNGRKAEIEFNEYSEYNEEKKSTLIEHIQIILDFKDELLENT